VPGRSIPVPDTVSAELRADIAAPYRLPNWNANPKAPWNGKNWSPDLRSGCRRTAGHPGKLGVTMQPAVIGGVNAFILGAEGDATANRNRLLVHLHGGGYVYNPGESRQKRPR